MDGTLNLISTGDVLSKKYGFTPTAAVLGAWPNSYDKFVEADEVKEMAKFCISKWKPDLRNVNIAYVFKQKAGKSGENVTLGTAKTESDLNKVLHSYEAVIIIGFDTWIALDLDQQLRLCLHELYHLALDPEKDKLGTVPHQIEEFADVVEIFGPGNDSQVAMIQAYMSFNKSHGSISKSNKDLEAEKEA